MNASDALTTVEVDTVFSEGESRSGFFAQLKADYDLDGKVVREHGPAGGNPVVQLTGTTTNLRSALKQLWSCDEDDLRECYGL